MRLSSYSHQVWRFVEDQNRASTMKLAETLADQETLEQLLDASKPPVPQPCQHLNYLQFTPFRYRPRQATRFRPAGGVEGVFYAAQDVKTAAAEIAFSRLLFFAESPGLPMPAEPLALSAFSTLVQTDKLLDLTSSAWDEERGDIEASSDYSASLRVAKLAREAGTEAILYNSVRNHGGKNLAVLECRAFPEAKISPPEGWHLSLHRDRVIARKEFGDAGFEFTVANFQSDPRIRQAVEEGTLAA